MTERPAHRARLRPPFRRTVLQRTSTAVVLLATGAICAAPVSAQDGAGDPDDPLRIPDIVVTATRIPMDRARLSTPVTVVTRETLQARGIRTLSQALEWVAGATVASAGADGGQTSLFLRGAESDYVKVLVDGVPVNDAGGAIDLADLSVDQVERIEVVRGPASVLYGSDGVAGVIQIFTARGRGVPRLTLSALGGVGEQRHADGSYPLMDLQGTLAGSSGGVSYLVGGARTWTEGAYPLNNERRLDSGNARIAWEGGRSGISLASRFTDSRSGFPTDGGGSLEDENAYIDRQSWTLSADATHRLSERLEARLQLGLTDRDQLTDDAQDGPDDTAGTYASRLASETTRRSAELRLSALALGGTASAGVSHEVLEGSSRYDAESEFGPTGAEAEYERSNTGVYGQLLTTPVDGFHVTLGGRLDYNEEFGRFETFRLGAAWQLGDETRLRAALGRAFREPTFGENYGSGFGDNGNASLDPERTRSWEVGAEHRVGALLVGATWFDQRFEDLIQFTFATDDPADPNYVNVGAAQSKGLELTGQTALGRVELTGAYTWLQTRVLDPGLASDATFVEGEALLRRPEHTGTVGARYGFAAGSIGAGLRWVGERADVDYGSGFPAPRVTLPSHTTVDLSGSYALPLGGGPRTELLLRVENLLDSNYEDIAGFPARGRILRLGARFELGG